MQKLTFLTLLLIVFVSNSALSDPNPEVKIIKIGNVTPIEGHELIPGVDEENGKRLVASTIALVKGEDATIIVDPGFADDIHPVLKSLKKLGVHPKKVTHVFTSHHHPDHTRHVGLFYNAKWVDFWASYENDLWEDHPDMYQIAPGIVVKRTPGHTKQDASLLVKTDQGTVVFTHLWWSRNFFPDIADPLAEDPDALKKNREYVLDPLNIPDLYCIVPGHGEPFRPNFPDDTCDLISDDHQKWSVQQ